MKFKADTKLTSTESGVWTEFQGCEFLIAHMSSLRFQRALNRGQQPVKKQIDAGTLDPGKNKEIMCRAMAEGILLDWRGVTDSNDVDVPYSIEAGFNALMNQQDFREFVSEFSMMLANFKREEAKELGNS